MWILVVTLLSGTVAIPTDNINACQNAGFNMVRHEAALHGGGSDSYFFCVDGETGEIWTNVNIHE